VLPDPLLFFGFEELDFCMRVKKNGFRIVVDGNLYYQYREFHNNINKTTPLLSLRTGRTAIVRDYYSKRNLLYIFKCNFLFIALLILLCKIIFKTIIIFSKGLDVGLFNMKFMIYAVFHGLFNSMGKRFNIR
jgi:GT2 family glycosyltransferase